MLQVLIRLFFVRNQPSASSILDQSSPQEAFWRSLPGYAVDLLRTNGQGIRRKFLVLPWVGPVTRSELIARLAAKNPALYHRDIERLVGTILDEIGGALERGDRVELRGFGAFSVRERKARVGRNPRTGASVDVAEKRVPFFKMGKGMRERLNR